MRYTLHTASACTHAATSMYTHASQTSRPNECSPENGGTQTSATTIPVRIRLPISGHVTVEEPCGEESLASTAHLLDYATQCPHPSTHRLRLQAIEPDVRSIRMPLEFRSSST